jgi:putative hydrolase of HD superfamily
LTHDSIPDRLRRQMDFIDRLQPILLNYHTNGRSWKEHSITVDMPMSLGPRVIEKASSVLADYARDLILRASDSGFFHSPDYSKC